MTARRGRGLGWQWLAKGLSERDWAILFDLARLRLATGRQLQRLHVADGSPLTQSRRSRSILQRLSDIGVLVRLERQVGGVHAGSSGFTYGLSAAGQRLTSSVGPAGGQRLRRPWEPAPSFVDHVLLVTELYVVLREAEAAKEFEILDFEAEPPCWRWWHGPSGERLVLKPDAFVRLGVGEFEQVSFVEVDRSTESTTVLRRKAETCRLLAQWAGAGPGRAVPPLRLAGTGQEATGAADGGARPARSRRLAAVPGGPLRRGRLGTGGTAATGGRAKAVW